MKDEFGQRVTVAVIPHASHALIPEQPQAVVDALVALDQEIAAVMMRAAPGGSTMRCSRIAGALLVANGRAQAWPDQPIRMVVGYAAGGTTDVDGTAGRRTAGGADRQAC